MSRRFVPKRILDVWFYKTDSGKEPVREWLKSLTKENKKSIGGDIKTVQFGWPIGMPIVRKLNPGIWEVRSHIKDGIARVIFTLFKNDMVLLHGFVKKSQKTPKEDIEIALKRKRNLEKEI